MEVGPRDRDRLSSRKSPRPDVDDRHQTRPRARADAQMEKLRRRSVLLLGGHFKFLDAHPPDSGETCWHAVARRVRATAAVDVEYAQGARADGTHAAVRARPRAVLGKSTSRPILKRTVVIVVVSRISPLPCRPRPLPCRTRRSSRGFAASARMLSVRRWPRARNSRDSTTRLACSKFARNSTRNSRTATRDAPSCSAARARASPPTARRASPPPPNASPPPPPTVRTALAPPRPLAPSRPSVPTPRAWTTTTRATRVASRSRVVEGHLDATPPPPTAPPRAPPRTPGGTASTRPPPWTPTNAVADARAMPPSRPRPRRPIPSPRTSPPRLSRRIPPRRTT